MQNNRAGRVFLFFDKPVGVEPLVAVIVNQFSAPHHSVNPSPGNKNHL